MGVASHTVLLAVLYERNEYKNRFPQFTPVIWTTRNRRGLRQYLQHLDILGFGRFCLHPFSSSSSLMELFSVNLQARAWLMICHR